MVTVVAVCKILTPTVSNLRMMLVVLRTSDSELKLSVLKYFAVNVYKHLKHSSSTAIFSLLNLIKLYAAVKFSVNYCNIISLTM